MINNCLQKASSEIVLGKDDKRESRGTYSNRDSVDDSGKQELIEYLTSSYDGVGSFDGQYTPSAQFVNCGTTSPLSLE